MQTEHTQEENSNVDQILREFVSRSVSEESVDDKNLPNRIRYDSSKKMKKQIKY